MCILKKTQLKDRVKCKIDYRAFKIKNITLKFLHVNQNCHID